MALNPIDKGQYNVNLSLDGKCLCDSGDSGFFRVDGPADPGAQRIISKSR